MFFYVLLLILYTVPFTLTSFKICSSYTVKYVPPIVLKIKFSRHNKLSPSSLLLNSLNLSTDTVNFVSFNSTGQVDSASNVKETWQTKIWLFLLSHICLFLLGPFSVSNFDVYYLLYSPLREKTYIIPCTSIGGKQK